LLQIRLNFISDKGRRVCTDQKDGAAEVKVSSGDTHPTFGGTPLFIYYIPLSHKTCEKVG